MKVSVDPDKCCGFGDCVMVAPSLFQIGEDNRAHLIRGGDVFGPDADLAREASDSCPVEAIDVAE